MDLRFLDLWICDIIRLTGGSFPQISSYGCGHHHGYLYGHGRTDNFGFAGRRKRFVWSFA